MNKINAIMKKYSFFRIFIFFIALFIAISEIVFSYSMKLFLDNINNIDYKYLYIFLFAALTSIFLTYFLNIIIAKKTTYIKDEIFKKVGESILKTDTKIIESEDPVSLTFRTYESINTVLKFKIESMPFFISNLCIVLIALFLMLRINIIVFLALLLTIPLNMIIYKIFEKKLQNLMSTNLDYMARYFGLVFQFLDNIREIKLFNWFEVLPKRLRNLRSKRIDYILKSGTYDGIMVGIQHFIKYIFMVLFLVISGYSIIKSEMTIPTFMMLLIIVNLYFDKISQIIDFYSIRIKYKDAEKIIDKRTNAQKENKGDIILNSIDEIKIDKLCFSYDDKQIFKDKSLHLKKGNIYRLNGANGSGKTTLIKLLIGLYSDYSGKIIYNGYQINDIDMINLRKNEIAIVEQEPKLMRDTIEENILYDNEYKNLKMDYLIDYFEIRDIFKKYSNKILFGQESDDLNAILSGGQRQKVAIIRAFNKMPSLMILDEPTSALDQESSKKLLDLINSEKDSRITIIIGHDESILEICDEVIEV